MTTQEKKQLLDEIEKATRDAASNDVTVNNSWKYGYLTGLRKAAEIAGITSHEEKEAISKGLA